MQILRTLRFFPSYCVMSTTTLRAAKNYEIEGYNDITLRIVAALLTDSFETVKFLISRRHTTHSSLFTTALKLSDDSFIPLLLNFSFFLLNYSCDGFTIRGIEHFSSHEISSKSKTNYQIMRKRLRKIAQKLFVSCTRTKCNV